MKKKEAKIFRDTIKKLGEHACAVCAEKADAVAGFRPDHPEKFNMTENDALYFPICTKCLDEGFDPEFMEATPLHAGTKLTVE